MRRIPWIPLVLIACGENHFASAEAWLTLDLGPQEQLGLNVVVRTWPEAWPERLFSDAVRVAYRADPDASEPDEQVTIASPEGRDTREWPGALNVLDAWDGCEIGLPCERFVPLSITCDRPDEACPGGLSAEAYLSTRGWGEAPPGSLEVVLSRPSP